MNRTTPTPRSTWARLRRRGLVLFIVFFGVGLSLVALAILTAMLLIVAVVEAQMTIIATGLFYFGPWIVLFSVLLAAFVFRREERKFRDKIARQICTACGYDLRGSIEAGRTECPECGCIIEKL